MSHAPEVNPAGGENVGVGGHPDNIVSLLPAGEVRSITDVVRATCGPSVERVSPSYYS